MPDYEYGRIKVLAERLESAGIPAEIIEEIMAGGEDIRKSAKPEKKAGWMKIAMDRMDALLDAPTRQAVRESCACCLGGKRLEQSKGIAKKHHTLADRLKAANETPFVFGHSVTLLEDGRVMVAFAPEGLENYRCVCLPKAKGPVSETYCYCCGGHIKHHLQHALGRSVTCTVRSSALESGGKSPCTFLFSIEE